MSILCDRQIMERCVTPSHMLRVDDKWTPVIAGVTHTQEQIDNWVARGYSRLNAIKLPVQLDEYNWKPMISPFVPEAVRYITNVSTSEGQTTGKGEVISLASQVSRQKIISYGLSSYGYDIRIKAEGIKLFNGPVDGIIDPMRPYDDQLTDPEILFDKEFGLHYFILPPNSVALAHTVEYFRVPRDILITCLGKSTYARVGISQIVTPLEPEWEGELVLEIASMIGRAARVYLGTGIAQLLFMKADEVCRTSYKDKGGKYMHQTGTQLARL